ncbi:ribosomal protein RPL7 [Cardiosporidium cionae]|uniref:Ribosomal protein RPL7 n=1 Tax=Cardiosporidium cionae TaxID=476202 RepID=A0ABQ7J9D9_9APIC|nr:ribosomal protein RPL7 [Cardiosporidium cionae]|eukprot:KAF8820616.1 ribosomal protein RPL7 [Cardiosporidium cionae]
MADRFLIQNLRISSQAPLSENMKKKIERNTSLKQRQETTLAAYKKLNKRLRSEMKIRIHSRLALSLKEERKLITARRVARQNGGFYRESDPKIMFVIRIRGINKLPPKPKMILRLFRLRQINNGVFIKCNKATMEMLKFVQPYVTYGYPSRKTIRELVYKRGFARIGPTGSKQRLRITNNEIIRRYLGKYKIFGIEDVIHELTTCGPNFKQVNNFLWPFKLSNPRKGFVAKRHGFNECKGGDWGNREELINELVQRMN